MADQQYCLRWNNHQSTLISVFDSLQERGCMVDCTLAAEGQSLEAHKVVLSACSPYLEDLLSKHYDKHPILLLKDVKFSELKAIIDYMYRGEVNVAQDKLGTFLQAAESLQIKGLSECGGREPPNTGGSNSFQSAAKRTVKGIPVVGGGKFSKNLEQRRQPNPSLEVQLDGSTDDCSVSPNLRKRRKQQESQSDDGVDFDAAGNALESSVLSPAVAPASTICATSKEILPAVPISKVTDSSLRMMSSDKDISCDSFETDDIEDAIVKTPAMTLEENVIKEKLEHSSELLIEPKLEYEDEEDEHDLTHEGDGIENSVFRPGPSHPRQSGYQTLTSNDQDEVFIAAQEAAGISGDAQGYVYLEPVANNKRKQRTKLADFGDVLNPISGTGADQYQAFVFPSAPLSSKESHPKEVTTQTPSLAPDQRKPNKPFVCTECGRSYQQNASLWRHRHFECGISPQFQCQYCIFRCKQKSSLKTHVIRMHNEV